MKQISRGSVRIIGGQWRGSKLPVAEAAGLRPTSDRVRETLFNWLQAVLPGASVLDLFAGTGALGFEAGSRGAARVVMIERDPTLAASLHASATRLQAGSIDIVCDDALRWLAHDPGQRFDIVFLDPPFAAGLWHPASAALQSCLADDAWIYVEGPADATPVVPKNWYLHREGRTRDVRFALYRRGAATLAADSAEQDSASA
ncbi:MAG: 16S rRNA (guanine(966)-N(2))-methyltransferase RsmD [Lysobacteraceae bacterium]